jgi:hypothetical protein
MLRPGLPGVWVRFPTGTKDSFPLSLEGVSGPRRLLSNGYQAIIPSVKRPRREADCTCLHDLLLNEDHGQIYLYFIVQRLCFILLAGYVLGLLFGSKDVDGTFEISVNFYQTKHCQFPQDSNINRYSCEIVKSSEAALWLQNIKSNTANTEAYNYSDHNSFRFVVMTSFRLILCLSNGCFVIYIPSSDKATIFHNHAEELVV